MNAYELADIVDKWAYSESAEYLTDAANMLRQQADRIAELEKDGKVCATCGGLVYDPVLKQTKPLSDEEIKTIWMKRPANCAENVLRFARAIEERHGIK